MASDVSSWRLNKPFRNKTENGSVLNYSSIKYRKLLHYFSGCNTISILNFISTAESRVEELLKSYLEIMNCVIILQFIFSKGTSRNSV
jgi:hypothetical protein